MVGVSKQRRALFLTTLAALLVATPAFANCASPPGNPGDVLYSSISNIMTYCNGTAWISMGATSNVGFGTLTNGDFCTATSGSNIACSTAGINLATQVTGVLPGASGGTGVNNGANTITLGGNLTTSGAFPLTLTTTAATNVTLPTSGTLLATSATPAVGDILYYNGSAWTDLAHGTSGQYLQTQGASAPQWATISIGTAALTGTLQVSQGGTGDVTLTAFGVLLGNGTGNVASTAAGATGTVLVGSTGANPVFSASPSVTSLTLSAIETLSFGPDYTTTGLQSDVAMNANSAIRYNGSGTATFYGIVAGTAGQILNLHNASTSALTLSNQSTSDGTLANRIITGTGADLVMATNSSVSLQYDGTAQRWRVIGGSGGVSGAGTTNYVARWTPNGTMLGTGVIYDNGSNVGIGTTAPAVALDVNGMVQSTSGYNINGNVANIMTANNTNVLNRNSASGNQIQLGAATNGFWQSLAFFTGNGSTSTQQMTIGSTGNVGIGTTTAIGVKRL